LALKFLYRFNPRVNDMRIMLYIVGLGVIILLLNLIADSNLISIYASPATNMNLTSMPSSLDSARSHLADAIRLLKLGNTQAASTEVAAANQIITQFQHSMRNVMNSLNRNNMMMPRMQQQAQPEVLNMNNNSNNGAMAQSPLMVNGGKLNQNEMRNMLSSTANNNTNTNTSMMGGVNTTSHFDKK
jgi:hypothetical protein